VSIGRYRFAERTDEPVVLHMGAVPTQPGLSPREQAAAGRRRLATLSFTELERSIRDQLARALGPGGFDPARDIDGICANRWSHGYAYEYMRPWDAYWPDGPLPIETARRRHGRIAIANADSGRLRLRALLRSTRASGPCASSWAPRPTRPRSAIFRDRRAHCSGSIAGLETARRSGRACPGCHQAMP
jgi:hypothetical protein